MLCASLDGAHVAHVTGARVALWATATQARVGEVTGDAAAFATSERLITLSHRDASTQLAVFTVPGLAPAGQLSLPGRLRLLCTVGPRVLVTTETMESPRVITVLSRPVADPIALREPVLWAIAAPDDRLLAAARPREVVLECWDPALRRALFRLNLPLQPSARRAGFAARRRLLWVAANDPVGTLEVFRFSDGRLQQRTELGQPIVDVDGHPDSPRIVVGSRSAAESSIEGASGSIELWTIDLTRADRQRLAQDSGNSGPVAGFCVAEGAKAWVVVDPGHAAPLAWLALERVLPDPPPAEAVADAVAEAAAEPGRPSLVPRRPTRLVDAHDWRARLGHRDSAALAAPPSAQPGTISTVTTQHAPLAEAPPAGWRERLCRWGGAVLAAPERAAAPLELPETASLTRLTQRLELDARAASCLALLYANWLLGDGDLGVPAATLARAVGDVGTVGPDTTELDDADGLAWAEALGTGLLGQLDLVQPRRGRLRLRPAVGRFLDGLPPRVRVIRGSGPPGDALPLGPVVYLGDSAPFEVIAAQLADRTGCDFALITLPAERSRRRLRAGLLEARLRGARALVEVSGDPASWRAALDGEPAVILVRGPVPPALADLPRWG